MFPGIVALEQRANVLSSYIMIDIRVQILHIKSDKEAVPRYSDRL